MKKFFTLSLAVMLSMLFANVATAKQLYVIGGSVFGGWDHPGTPVPMTLGDDGITNTMNVSLTGAEWWTICDGADSDWDVFNSTYRYGVQPGDYDVTIGEYQLKKCNGTFKLGAGDYTITVNSETMLMTITGKKEDLVISSMSIVGDLVGGWPNEVGWNIAQDMNKISDTKWTLTLTNRLLHDGYYSWKVTANHRWGDLEIPSDGSNKSLRVDEMGYYTLNFTVDLSGEEPTATVDIEKTAEATEEDFVTSYYMVGSSSELFGTPWDIYNEANKMDVSAEDEYIFTKTYTNVSLSAGTIEYQSVCRDNTGSIEWIPGENQELVIEANGVYNATFELNLDTWRVKVTSLTEGQAQGDPTCIRSIEIKKSNATIYNLNGQRVSNPVKGLYIIDGRKYAVK